MLFSDRPRTHYENAPVHEVICQLRFPPILSINQIEPAEFQESIRDAFPQYARREDAMPPKVTGAGTANMQIQPVPPVTNYHFVSEDGAWRLNLTRDFFAISTLRYGGWEEFARHLDRPLASFIRLYKPAFFQRVGLRYRNFFSRARLDLEGVSWSELFTPAYVGVYGEEDVREDRVASSGLDVIIRLDSSCQAKIHAGPGQIKAPTGQTDPETKFILDLDLFMGERTACTLAAAALETLHGHADRVFEGAITDTLRNAML